MRTEEDAPVAEALADAVSRLGYADLPPDVVEKTKYVVLDQLGCQLACSGLPWNRIVYDYVRELGGAGRSSVVGHGLRTSAESAALVNGTFGHGFEIDDFHIRCLAHPGCVAVPAALAVAEGRGASGRDFIAAAALAAEVILRVGKASGYSSVVERGFHETSVQGPFGAAAGAGKLLGLDREKLLHGLSIAGSHASGTLEYAQTGGDVKRLHAGIAAAAGIRSALLAERGLTGPPTVLEGRRGVFQAFANAYDAGAAVDGLGESYHLLGIGFKAYCCMGLIHSQIDAVRELVDEHRLADADIDEIVLGTSRLGLSHGGSAGPAPQSISEAQFSSHFSIGLTVVKGANDFGAYWEAFENGFRDPRVLDVARRVTLVLDDECDRAFPEHNMCKATIRTRDGRSLETTIPDARGFPGNPLTPGELEQKFIGLATVVLPESRAARLMETILTLEQLEDVRELTELAVGQLVTT
jgi:2-methylcitrate dehydratase PrpD